MNKVFYIQVGDKLVEVIQNPTSSDYRQMSKEVLRQYPNFPVGTPKFRSTYNKQGTNHYLWKAGEAIHSHIEPSLSKLVKSTLTQNPTNHY